MIPLPTLHDRPDRSGTDDSGVLFLATPCRPSYKKKAPFPSDRLKETMGRVWERVESLGGFNPRPIPVIQSNGPRVWAEKTCFRVQIWQEASKKATHWMPDPQTPESRAAFFFGRKGACVAIAMPYCDKEESPTVVPLSEYEAHGLDTTPKEAQHQFSRPWERFTPHDKYHRDDTHRDILVPLGSTVAETIAKTPEYRHYSIEGWKRVTPQEHKNCRPIGHTPPGPAVNTLTRLQWRLSMFYNNQCDRAIRRAGIMPLESLRRILEDEETKKAFGLDFQYAAERRLSI